MSKNLTRKGLAIGATLAIGVSALVAQPAAAANEIDLGLSSGVSYTMISGETLTVQATVGSTIIAAQYDKVKYSIGNAGELAVTTTLTATGSGGDTDLAAATATTGVVKSNAGTITAQATTLAVSVPAASAGTVTVQAWIDADADDTIDANEYSSAVRTLTFVKLADVTWTTVLAQPALGSDDFAADLTTSPVLNYQQIASAVKIGVASVAAGVYTKLDDVEDNAANGATTVDGAGVFSAGISVTGSDSKLSFSDTDVEDNAAAGVYVAQALFDPAAAAIGEVGAESYKTVAAATITGMGEVVAEDSANLDFTANGGADTIAVRATASSVPVTVTATGATAAVTITVTITESTVGGNTDAATFSAGGKTLKDAVAGTAESISFDVVSDATGKASFTITSSGALAGDAVTLSATAQGFSSANATVATWTKATIASVANVDVAGTNAVLKAAKDANYTLNYAVKDIFGVLATNSGDHRLKVDDGTTTKYVAVTAGKASVTFSNATAGNLTLTAEVQALHTDGNYYDLNSLPAGNYADKSTTTTVVIGTSAAASAIALTAAGGAGNNGFGTTASAVALNANNAQSAADTRLGDTAPTVAGGVAVSGTVSDATTAGTYSTVTLSGPNFLFSVAQGKYAVGSITVQTDASGAFSTVTVYSNKSGSQTLTVTAGSVTKTQALVFALADDNAGKSLVITAPDYVAPGSTLSITGTVTDTYGNAIDTDGTNTAGDAGADFKVTYTGPGLQVGTTPTQTDSSGQAKLGYFLGSNDTGTVSVTFSYDANGDADYTDTGDLVVTKVITIGKAGETVIGSYSGRVAVRVEGQKGQKLSVKVGTKWYVVASVPTDKYVWSVKSRKGAVVKVSAYINGDLENTSTITVK